MEIMVGATVCVRCTEVVRISECPLLEVLLYSPTKYLAAAILATDNDIIKKINELLREVGMAVPKSRGTRLIYNSTK